MLHKIEEYFEIKKRGSTINKEVVAGITNFLSLMYILIVVPSILNDGGVPLEHGFLSVAFITMLGTLIAGVYANYPIVIVASIGTNAILAYNKVGFNGYTWEMGMTAVFIAGLLFFLLAVTGIRELVIRSIPVDLQYAVIGGIGLFITFIGLQNSGLVVSGPNLVQLGDISSKKLLLVILSVCIHIVLLMRKNNYAIVIGLFVTTIIGLLMGVVQMPTKVFAVPNFSVKQLMPGLKGFSMIFNTSMIMLIFSILFTNFFDSLGTLLAVGEKTGLIENGKVEGARRAMTVDACSTALGGLIGSGGTTTALESLVGISIGAKTGLSAVISSLLFFIIMFFSPIITMMNNYVTSPILIVLGGLMASNLSKIQFNKIEYGMPSFFIIVLMPLLFSIPQGMAIGFLVYTISMLSQGRYKEIPIMLYFLNIIFVIYFLFQ